MKQIVQNLKTGDTVLEEIPAPHVKPGHVLIQTTMSLVSAGTERMLVEFGHANLIQKARQQPDKVKMVLDKIRSDGLLPTLEAVFNPQITPVPSPGATGQAQIFADYPSTIFRTYGAGADDTDLRIEGLNHGKKP